MIIDRAWMKRNIGFDPVTTERPAAIYANKKAVGPNASLDDIQRDIIDFDSEGPEGAAFKALTAATGLSKFTSIPWPSGLAPQTAANAPGTGATALPHADVLVVTWTVDEGHALSRVLTPGKDSRDDYVPYTHNFAAISKGMSHGSPAVKAGRLGAFWTTTIADKTALVLKSESHLSQDTDKHFPTSGVLPNAEFWRQIIAETQPKLIITTGTAGGIGADFEVGDVVVSGEARFDSQKWLKPASFSEKAYPGSAANTQHFAQAKTLFAANSAQLPKDNTRQPKIVVGAPGALPSSVVTTDFFGFDTTGNVFNLKGVGDACEMGDAVLGMVAQQLGSQAPAWIAVRNVSDPQMNSNGVSITQAGDMANDIYKKYGRWSSVCSGIVCWALIAAL